MLNIYLAILFLSIKDDLLQSFFIIDNIFFYFLIKMEFDK